MAKSIGIVGAGTIGSGIARAVAQAGLDVLIYDINETVLRRAFELLKGEFKKLVEAGSLTQEELSTVVGRIHPRTSLGDLRACELVIESVIEDLRIKKDLFKHLETHVKPVTILASATSTLSLTAIASAAKLPERFVGLHFLYPAATSPMVEVVKGDQTSAGTIDKAIQFVSSIGKTPIAVQDAPGFVVNRLRASFWGEALRVLGESVADHEHIDAIVRSVGAFKRGPFESMDQVGIDQSLAIMQSLYDRSCGDPRYRVHPIQKRMVESGTTGRKSGRGFYPYMKDTKR